MSGSSKRLRKRAMVARKIGRQPGEIRHAGSLSFRMGSLIAPCDRTFSIFLLFGEFLLPRPISRLCRHSGFAIYPQSVNHM